MIQSIEGQCGGISIADIYVKIFEDNLQNNFGKYIFCNFFSQIFIEYIQIKVMGSLWCQKLLQNNEYLCHLQIFGTDLYRIIFTHKM